MDQNNLTDVLQQQIDAQIQRVERIKYQQDSSRSLPRYSNGWKADEGRLEIIGAEGTTDCRVITNGAIAKGDRLIVCGTTADKMPRVPDVVRGELEIKRKTDFVSAYIYRKEIAGTVGIVCGATPPDPGSLPALPPDDPLGSPPIGETLQIWVCTTYQNDSNLYAGYPAEFPDIGRYEFRFPNSTYNIYAYGCWEGVVEFPFLGGYPIAFPSNVPTGWNGTIGAQGIITQPRYIDPAGWRVANVDYSGLIQAGYIPPNNPSSPGTGIFLAFGHSGMAPPTLVYYQDRSANPPYACVVATGAWAKVYDAPSPGNQSGGGGGGETPADDPDNPGSTKFEFYLGGFAPAKVKLLELAKNQTFSDQPEILFPSRGKALVILKYGRSHNDGDTNAASINGSCKVKIMLINKDGTIDDEEVFTWQQAPAETGALIDEKHPKGANIFNAYVAYHYDPIEDTATLDSLVDAGKLNPYFKHDPEKAFWLHRHCRNLKKDRKGRLAIAISDPYDSTIPLDPIPSNLVTDSTYYPALADVKAADKSVKIRYLYLKKGADGASTVKEDKTLSKRTFTIKSANESGIDPDKFKVITLAVGIFES